MKHSNKKLNIIYICIAEKGPSGGGKTIYRHSEIINNLKRGLSSQVLHIKKIKYKKWRASLKKILKIEEQKFYGWKVDDITVNKNFKSGWLKSKINIKNDFEFNKNEDFVIIPEIFAHFANELFIKKKISYGIFVQNGYCLNPTNNYLSLNRAYQKAKFILSYSKDISNCIKLAFPGAEKKILKTNISIDKSKFDFKIKKENIITYMPRKLPVHSDNLIFFLRNYLHKSWKIKPLHNLNENDVYKYLLKSKIFLSFSNMEGLGIPPIEAAIAGNRVIGYTGQGGKEYWQNPIFTEIPHGNIRKFIYEILNQIKVKKFNNKLWSYRKKIINKFSPAQEKKYLIKMINKIRIQK